MHIQGCVCEDHKCRNVLFINLEEGTLTQTRTNVDLSSFRVVFSGTSRFAKYMYPVSILHKSIAGRYRPVSYPDGPITAHYRFM